MAGMVIGILLFVTLEACVIIYVIKSMGPVKQDPGKDDWRRYGDEWNRRH